MNNNKRTLKEHIDFWDKWHKEWLDSFSLETFPRVIQEWPVPSFDGGTNINLEKEKSFKFFPEPYWGRIEEKANAVFINYNPGAGGHLQHIDTYHEFQNLKTKPLLCHKLWSIYDSIENKMIYSKTVKALSEEKEYPTTEWFRSKRGNWAKCLYNNLGENHQVPGVNIIMFEMCPWHTHSTDNSLLAYLKGESKNKLTATVPKLFIRDILDFAIAKSSEIEGKLKNIIFCKGNILPIIVKLNGLCGIKDITSTLLIPGIQSTNDCLIFGKNGNGKGGWKINVFLKDETFIINCYGANGGGNGFPKNGKNDPFFLLIDHIINKVAKVL